jgi:hypothetical protein
MKGKPMRFLALLPFVALAACDGNPACDPLMAEYRTTRALYASAPSPEAAAKVERAWLAIPHFCSGRPDKPLG